MHLPRLWTDAPVARKTQVNKKREGQTGKKESIFGPDRSKKGLTQRTKGAKTEIGYGRQSDEVIRGVRPRKIEGGGKRAMSDSV